VTRPRPFLHTITWRHDDHGNPTEPVGSEWIRAQAAQRRVDYDALCGVADGWPIRLTDVGQPAEPLEVEFRRLVEAAR
jgi:hypothetical protein